MRDVKVQTIWPKDHEKILELYVKVYQALGEDWTKEQIRDFMRYLLRRPLKLKLVYRGKIIGWFISDIKPRHTWNLLFDPELFIDPDHQQSGFWTFLLKQSFEIAKKQYNISELVAFTFKDSYQLKRYQKLGMKTDEYRQMLYANIDQVISKLS